MSNSSLTVPYDVHRAAYYTMPKLTGSTSGHSFRSDTQEVVAHNQSFSMSYEELAKRFQYDQTKNMTGNMTEKPTFTAPNSSGPDITPV